MISDWGISNLEVDGRWWMVDGLSWGKRGGGAVVVITYAHCIGEP